MSHFTTIKTKFVAIEPLTAALADIRAQFNLGELRQNTAINGWRGNTTRGDLVLATRNAGYDVGFIKTGDTYDLTADQYGIHDFKMEQLTTALQQRYAYHAVKQKLDQQGFSLVEEEQQQGGAIHLVLRRTV